MCSYFHSLWKFKNHPDVVYQQISQDPQANFYNILIEALGQGAAARYDDAMDKATIGGFLRNNNYTQADVSVEIIGVYSSKGEANKAFNKFRDDIHHNQPEKIYLNANCSRNENPLHYLIEIRFADNTLHFYTSTTPLQRLNGKFNAAYSENVKGTQCPFARYVIENGISYHDDSFTLTETPIPANKNPGQVRRAAIEQHRNFGFDVLNK